VAPTLPAPMTLTLCFDMRSSPPIERKPPPPGGHPVRKEQ